jgi:hypothetical protein
MAYTGEKADATGTADPIVFFDAFFFFFGFAFCGNDNSN